MVKGRALSYSRCAEKDGGEWHSESGFAALEVDLLRIREK